MPLARYAMYAKGIDVWCAPTWDNGDTWVATLRHIAKEGRVYVIGVAPLLRGSDVPKDVPGRTDLWGGKDDWMSRGFSTIVGPDGDILAGPLLEKEGILYADLDVDRARASRYQFDPVGHYARPDIFRLTVNDEEMPPAVSLNGDRPSQAAQRVAEKPPVRVGERRALVAVRHDLLSLGDSIREVRRRDIRRAHAEVQPLHGARVVNR